MSFGEICTFKRGGFDETATSFKPDLKDLKYVNKSPNEDIKYAKEGDSGFDLRAWIKEGDTNAKQNKEGNWFIELKPSDRMLVHTGLYVNLPKNCEMQVRTRSGMALKYGVIVGNSPGTVDLFYTGEVGVILINLSKKNVIITNGDRIAQGVICPVYNSTLVNLIRVDKIEENEIRGANGFGSSGYK